MKNGVIILFYLFSMFCFAETNNQLEVQSIRLPEIDGKFYKILDGRKHEIKSEKILISPKDKLSVYVYEPTDLKKLVCIPNLAVYITNFDCEYNNFFAS